MTVAAVLGSRPAPTEEDSTAMPEKPNGRLHLPSLSIRGFRGIGELDIPRLGRVTLLAGRNGVGKTAVLEAIRLYAARGREHVLSALLRRHEEFAPVIDEDDHRVFTFDPSALFHGRGAPPNSRIEIGPKGASGGGSLKIEAVVPSEEQLALLERLYRDAPPNAPKLVMEVSFANRKRTIPWDFVRGIRYSRSVDDQEELPSELSFRRLGPGLLINKEISELWDKVALTDDEDRAVQALNLVLDGGADRVTMIGDDDRRTNGRRVVVKLRGRDKPVPLRSLGDGAPRLFGLALSLAGSRNGFLVIDEAENGIHHSVHGDFWRMILRTAAENDVQVFAATHSFDCVRGFARALADSPGCDGVLVRLEKEDERTRAVVYSESALETAAEQGIEVR